jgi:pimeloyl-ACP methyl ester carboxylesterase
VAFIHGAGGNARGWDLQRPAFPEAVTPDLPGHAGEGHGYRRIEEYTAWLRAEGRARGWFPAVLAGHSMGGAIALECALTSPDDLAGIVLIGTGARLRVSPAILEALRADYRAAVEMIVGLSLSHKASPRLAGHLVETMMAAPQEVTQGDFEACDRFDAMGRLDGIRLPALIITGREDQMTPPRYAEYLHAHLPGSHLVWVAEAGHAVHLERPREVNEAIRQFVGGLARDGRQHGGP